MDARKQFWGCFHGRWRAHFFPNSPLDFLMQSPRLCAGKLLNLLMKIWDLAGILCFGNILDQRRLLRQLKLLNIFSQLVCCRPWAALDSSKQYALQFNVISSWTLSLLPLPQSEFQILWKLLGDESAYSCVTFFHYGVIQVLCCTPWLGMRHLLF